MKKDYIYPIWEDRWNSSQLRDMLQKTFLWTMLSLLLGHISIFQNLAQQAENAKLMILSLYHVSGILCPKTPDGMNNDAAVVRRKRIQVLQREFPADRFHVFSNRRFNLVRLTRSRKKVTSKKDKLRYRCSSGKILCFIKLCDNMTSKKMCDGRGYQSCPLCFHDAKKELCFLQLYEVLQPDNAPTDTAKKCLNCLQLRWQWSLGIACQLLPSNESGLVSIEFIRFVICVLEKSIQVTNMFKFRSYSTVDDHEQYAPHLWNVNNF